MHLLHSYQKSLILNKHTEKDWHDWLGWSYTQGNQTKNDAHLPLAVMTYILDKAYLSSIEVNTVLPPSCVNTQPVAATSEPAHQSPIRRALDFREVTCILVLRLQGPIQYVRGCCDYHHEDT